MKTQQTHEKQIIAVCTIIDIKCNRHKLNVCSACISHVIHNRNTIMSTSAALIACLQCVHIACTLYRNAIISTSAALNSCLQCVHITCIFQCKCYNQHSRSPQFMPNVFMPYVVHNRNTIMNTSAALKSCQHCVHIVCNLQQKRYDDQFLNTQFMAAWSRVRTK